MSDFDYKKWLLEQKDSLEPEDMPEEGDLDGDGEVSKEEIDIKKEFESELAKTIKRNNAEGDYDILDKGKFLQSVKDVRNSTRYNNIIQIANLYNSIDKGLELLFKNVASNYYAKYILGKKTIKPFEVVKAFEYLSDGEVDIDVDTLRDMAKDFDQDFTYNTQTLSFDK